MSMRKRLIAAMTTVVVMCSAAACAEPSITLLTGNTSGIYFPLGVSIAMIYADIPGAKVQVQTTDGSVENLSRLQQGTGQVGFALGDGCAPGTLVLSLYACTQHAVGKCGDKPGPHDG